MIFKLKWSSTDVIVSFDQLLCTCRVDAILPLLGEVLKPICHHPIQLMAPGG